MRLLVGEESVRLQKLLYGLLTGEGYLVDMVSDGAEALVCLQTGRYDGILLSVDLPITDGVSVVQMIRTHGDGTPVLLLAKHSTVEARVAGLDAGADDFMTRPCALSELLARVRAILRRRQTPMSTELCVGDVTLDFAARAMRRDDCLILLSRREFQIMEYLMRRPLYACAAEECMAAIWGWDSEVCSGALWVHISNVRKKLTAIGAHLQIRFQRGVGYRLCVEK